MASYTTVSRKAGRIDRNKCFEYSLDRQCWARTISVLLSLSASDVAMAVAIVPPLGPRILGIGECRPRSSPAVLYRLSMGVRHICRSVAIVASSVIGLLRSCRTSSPVILRFLSRTLKYVCCSVTIVASSAIGVLRRRRISRIDKKMGTGSKVQENERPLCVLRNVSDTMLSHLMFRPHPGIATRVSSIQRPAARTPHPNRSDIDDATIASAITSSPALCREFRRPPSSSPSTPMLPYPPRCSARVPSSDEATCESRVDAVRNPPAATGMVLARCVADSRAYAPFHA